MSAPDRLAALGLRSDGIPDSHPDAKLLRAIRVAADLDCQSEDAFANWNARPARRRGTKKQAHEVFSRLHRESEKATETVIRTPATTVDGARAKLRLVLRHSSFDDDPETAHPRGGTIMCLPISAMRDALAMLGEG